MSVQHMQSPAAQEAAAWEEEVKCAKENQSIGALMLTLDACVQHMQSLAARATAACRKSASVA